MSAPEKVRTADGMVWERRAETRAGLALYAVEGAAKCCPPFVMATLAELAEHGIAGVADVRPVGPQMPPFPPPPQTEEEKCRRDVARLQGLLAEAVSDAHRARRERDLMRERVSEPYGCKHCGEAKRTHGRRYVLSAGVHAWERPTDEQVKARMLARRAARSPLPATPELDQVLDDLTGVRLSLWEEERAYERLRVALESARRGRRVLRARVAELEAELYTEQAQHRTTLEQRNAHAQELLALRGGRAASYTATPEAHAQMREGLTRYFAGQGPVLEDPHDSPLHHDYRVGRDMPETGGAQ